MSGLGRLNTVIDALASGRRTFGTFAPAEPEIAIELQTSNYESVIFDGEHRGWDIRGLRDSLQYLLNRGQIAQSASLAPKVAPFTRVPANGSELNQFCAKQALDLGCYGIIWPHISTVEEAYNAVAACRYPRLKGRPLYEPAGLRGDGPAQAMRYWGVSMQDYYERADVWPLATQGELLVVIQIEDTVGIENLPSILREVPGVGVVLIGEGDLSQELGYPRQYEHKEVLDAVARIAAICNEHNVVVGHPHVTAKNVERLVSQGFRYLICSSPPNYGDLETSRRVE